MIILGLDPGTTKTGWALSDRETGTIKATSIKTMAFGIVEHVKKIEPEFVAIEAFEHQGWRRRKIDQERDMGWLIGYLHAKLEGLGVDFEDFPAGETKANMDMLKRRFPNSHEFSAYCVLNYAEGWLKIQQAKKGAL